MSFAEIYDWECLGCGADCIDPAQVRDVYPVTDGAGLWTGGWEHRPRRDGLISFCGRMHRKSAIMRATPATLHQPPRSLDAVHPVRRHDGRRIDG